MENLSLVHKPIRFLQLESDAQLKMASSVRLAEDEVGRLLADGSKEANFADKFVGDEAVRQISDELASNCSKTRILLDRNCVGADGAAALGDMLKVMCGIRYMPHKIQFGPSGFQSFEQLFFRFCSWWHLIHLETRIFSNRQNLSR